MLNRTAVPLTREMAATIKWLVAREGLMQHQAAARFGINQGRVSEVMNGKRFPDIPPAMILS